MTYWLWSIPPDVYPAAVRTGTLALRRQGRPRLADMAAGDRVFVYLSGRGAIVGEFEVVGEPFEDATALAPGRHMPHRVRVHPVAVLPSEAWISRDGVVDHLRVLEDYPEVPSGARFRRVVQQVVHPLPPIDGKVLEFVIQARLGTDPDTLMAAVEAVRDARDAGPTVAQVAEPATGYDASTFDRDSALRQLSQAIGSRGFQFEPWEVAAYVTALRTKPFVLLAGVTGVGKSKLPVLVSEATGGAAIVLPVRPDWTDPAETMGYTDLSGQFRPGAVLRAAQEASAGDRYHTLVLDEMNLGRPEHYLAEVLSRMEQRSQAPGGYETPPLLTDRLPHDDATWQAVRLPPTLGLVGTVNVDESAHVFSRKVLDRAFVLELAPRDLARWRAEPGPTQATDWPLDAWRPRAIRLSELDDLADSDRQRVERAVSAVNEANALLAPVGLGVGYRARDEIALFVLHAGEVGSGFRTSAGDDVDPLDVALLAKLLPRIDGARDRTRTAVEQLLSWAIDGEASSGVAARRHVEAWASDGYPRSITSARYPRMAARLARIVEGALDDGVSSYWA